jgi:hypothetical protein
MAIYIILRCRCGWLRDLHIHIIVHIVDMRMWTWQNATERTHDDDLQRLIPYEKELQHSIFLLISIVFYSDVIALFPWSYKHCLSSIVSRNQVQSLCQHMDVRYPALSVCISDAHIRPIRAISDGTLHNLRWWISTITSDGKSNEFPNTLVCPYVISDFYESFPVTFCYVPKVINTA